MSMGMSEKVRTMPELLELARGWKRAGKSMVWTNGCFEILHAGHIQFFLKAARLGDIFVVGVNSDASVAALKGAGHPLARLEERLTVLSAVACVQYLTVFEERTCANLLRALQPEVYAKGLRHVHGPIDADERAVIEEYGGCIALIGGNPAKSTTNIVRRIRATGG